MTKVKINPPNNDETFERQCCLLWEKEFDTDHFSLHGRKGQSQFGVDLYGYPKNDPNRIIAVQCKKRASKKLTHADVLAEFAKVQKFGKLDRYIIATTSETDAALQQLARDLTEIQSKTANPFIVEIFGWSKLQEMAETHDLIEIFDPNYSPIWRLQKEAITDIAARIDDVTDETRKVATAVGESRAEMRSMMEDILGKIDTRDAAKVESAIDSVILDAIEIFGDNIEPVMALAQKAFSAHKNIISATFKVKLLNTIAVYSSMLGKRDLSVDSYRQMQELATDPKEEMLYLIHQLMLEAKWDEIYQLYKTSRVVPSGDSNIEAAFIITHGRLGLSLPDSLTGTTANKGPIVSAAILEYLRLTEDPNWMSASREAHLRFPSDKQISMHFAQSVVFNITQNLSSVVYSSSSSDELDDLRSAVKVFCEIWSVLKKRGCIPKEYAGTVCANLALLHHLSRDRMSTLNVLEEGLVLVPESADLLSQAARIYYEVDREKFLKIIPTVPNTNTNLNLIFRFLYDIRDWKCMTAMFDESSADRVHQSERAVFTAILKAARIFSLGSVVSAGDVDLLLEEPFEDAGPPIALYPLFDDLGMEGITDRLWEIIVSKDVIHPMDRSMKASIAAKRHDWNVVFETLMGHVPPHQLSIELHLIAKSINRSGRMDAENANFFAMLPDHVRFTDDILVEEAIFLRRSGQLHEAMQAFSKLFNRTMNAFYLCNLVSCAYETETHDVADILSGITVENIVGRPASLLPLAEELFLNKFYSEALRLALRVYEDVPSLNREQAVSIANMISGCRVARELTEPTTIGLGCVVVLRSTSGKLFQFVISENLTKLCDFLSPDHSISRACIGLRQGDIVPANDSFGGSDQWQVALITTMYSRLFDVLVDRYDLTVKTVEG